MEDEGPIGEGEAGRPTRDERGRIELAVPFEEKDRAKAAGARWDQARRTWYVPTGRDPDPFAEWWPGPKLDLLPGEDGDFGGNALFVDLIPASCWFTNVRYCMSAKDWDRIRRMVYERSGHACEACRCSDDGLEAHERWDYDAAARKQILKRIVCLCRGCHRATHMGLAQARGEADDAMDHLRRVNGWTDEVCNLHVEEAFATWERRNRIDWSLDLSILENAGIRPKRSVQQHERKNVAQREFAKITADEAKKGYEAGILPLDRAKRICARWAATSYRSAIGSDAPSWLAEAADRLVEIMDDCRDDARIEMDGTQRKVLADALFWQSKNMRNTIPYGFDARETERTLKALRTWAEDQSETKMP